MVGIGNRRVWKTAWLWYLAVILLVAPVHAVDYYFSTSGNDGNSGTSTGSPWQTLAKFRSTLASGLNPGDTVSFKCGDTFNTGGASHGIEIFNGSSGSISNPVVIGRYGTCTGSNDPILNGTNTGSHHIVQFEGTSYVNFSNFTIQNCGGQCLWFTDSPPNLTHHITVSDVVMSSCNYGCVRIKDDSHDITITDFKISNSQEGFYIGTNADSTDNTNRITILRGEIYDCTQDAIEFKQGVFGVTVKHVYVHDISGSNGFGTQALNYTPGGVINVFENNWFENTSDTGGLFKGNVSAKYNLFVNNGIGPITLSGDYRNDATAFVQTGNPFNSAVFRYNTVVNGADEAINNDIGASLTSSDNVKWGNGSGNDASNPLFVNTATNDFNLQAGSPAIGSGAGGTDRGAFHSPSVASCEIGAVDATTLVVNWNNETFPPLSSVDNTKFAVTYDAVAQTESSTVIVGDNQTRTTMASAAGGTDDVDLVVSYQAVEDSALIGNQLNSRNRAQTIQCTNNVTGGAPAETLTQDVFRFYAIHRNEGAASVAPENGNIATYKGDRFRLRIGIRGGGVNAATRGYGLYARLCTPTPVCTSWIRVTDDATILNTIYHDDNNNTYANATTNQLSTGGKTFTIGGRFIDEVAAIPSVSIATGAQLEWEYGLEVTRIGPADPGDTIEYRIQHEDGTALSAYNAVPKVTIGSAGCSCGSGTTGGQSN